MADPNPPRQIDLTPFGVATAGPNALALGGALGGTGHYRPPPLAVGLLRTLTAVPPHTAPPMPALPADATDALIAAAAAVVWRAVRHREDRKLPSRPLGWARRTTGELCGAIRVWHGRAPDVSLHAVAAARWDGIYSWSGVRPRKPVAVMGRANDRDLDAARTIQRDAARRVLPPTKSAKALLGLREALLAELRKGCAQTDAAVAMIEQHRPHATALQAAAALEAAEVNTRLTADLDRGAWIWTCHKPA